MPESSWICLQIGAREHYALPRALHRAGLLQQLLTDTWVPPGSPLACHPRLNGRFHPDLAKASLRAPWLGSVLFEIRARIFGPPPGWPLTIARNTWFQRWACQQLRNLQAPDLSLFSYSYASKAVFRLSRDRGWRCILGQIDPGPVEEEIVVAEHRRYPQIISSWKPAPPSYWQQWAEECALADQIVVNSFWSQQCLQQQGMAEHKLRLIPLVYEPLPAARQDLTGASLRHHRIFQLLFLGTIGLRKGVARLLEAMRLLEGAPVQLTLAGPTEIDPSCWAALANVRWIGAVPRGKVEALYAGSDALVLPTLSDGFALTQLEALAYNCPVIASHCCGAVVSPGANGWLLPSLEPDAIAATIQEAIATAHLLPRPLQRPVFGLAQLADALGNVHSPRANP